MGTIEEHRKGCIRFPKKVDGVNVTQNWSLWKTLTTLSLRFEI